MSSDDSARVKLRPPAKTVRPPFDVRLPLRGSPELSNILTFVLARGAGALDAAADAVSRAARFLERLGEERLAPAPAQATVTFRSKAGGKVQHGFVVTNSRVSRLTGEIRSTDFYSDKETRPAADVVRFEPDHVDLAGGGAQRVRALVTIPQDVGSSEVLRATFYVAGSEKFRLPVELSVGRTAEVASHNPV
jgi:hypothetical protein